MMSKKSISKEQTQSNVRLLTPNEFNQELFTHSREKFKEIWTKKCGDCLAPCCLTEMYGYSFEDINGDESSFFTHDFIIMSIYNMSQQEHKEMGFQTQLDPIELKREHHGLRICPLSTPDGCLIYDNRPEMCKKFYCKMKVDDFNK